MFVLRITGSVEVPLWPVILQRTQDELADSHPRPDPAPNCRSRYVHVGIIAGTFTPNEHAGSTNVVLTLICSLWYIPDRYTAKNKIKNGQARHRRLPLSPRTRRRTAACGICCTSGASKNPKLPSRTAGFPRTPAAAPSRSARRTAGGRTAFSGLPGSAARCRRRRGAVRAGRGGSFRALPWGETHITYVWMGIDVNNRNRGEYYRRAHRPRPRT